MGLVNEVSAQIYPNATLLISTTSKTARIEMRGTFGTGPNIFILTNYNKAEDLYKLLTGQHITATEENTEIERSFMVANEQWKTSAETIKKTSIKQGYFHADENGAVRIRIQDGKATFCVKKKPNFEFEFPMNESVAQRLINVYEVPVIEKTRHVFEARKMSNGKSLKWEVDEYEGNLKGLVKAEIEVPNRATPIPAPHWLGDEVSHLKEYKDGYMAFNGMPKAPSRGIV